MSDAIKHECGIALVRLLKPLSYYIRKYGSAAYGINKLYLLMEKQHNRGQDGAGVASVKFDLRPGMQFIDRRRSIKNNAIKDIFQSISAKFDAAYKLDPGNLKNEDYLKQNVPFAGELLLGHLRYATHSKNGIQYCHPRIRQNNWKSRNLVVAGNFNMTNNDELFDLLVDLGQHPKDRTDTITVMEKIGHFLDRENEKLFASYKSESHTNKSISGMIADNFALENVLRPAAEDFDGGYAMAGLIGHGDAFVLRDPNGIRPAFYYTDDEIAVVTSERPPIQTAFDVPIENIKEIKPGHALIIKRNGQISETEIVPAREKKSCSFERIYFSRGTDRDIYKERKTLGRLITPKVLKSIDYDIDNTVFSYLPNTAETSFLGMVEGVEGYLRDWKKEQIAKAKNLDDENLERILSKHPRVEKITVKDAKLRTFITGDDERGDLVSHVYDTTYGIIRPEVDNLVIIDDSIVRGTTLKRSILSILDRLKPKKIVVVSSCPQIRFPDCYGIDMSKLQEFVAFRAAVQLLKENYKTSVLEDVYKKCKSQAYSAKEDVQNHVNEIYTPFSADEISAKISEIVTPEVMNAEVEIIYQGIDELHQACPGHLGDWYFTGDFPTPGGNKVVNKAFINFYEGRDERAY